MRCVHFFLWKTSLWLEYISNIFKINRQKLFRGSAYNELWIFKSMRLGGDDTRKISGEGTSDLRESLETSTKYAETSRLFSLHLDLVNW